MVTAVIPAERATGMTAGLRQITDTMAFEMKRNLNKAVLFCIVEVVLFLMLSLLYDFLTSTGYYPESTDAVAYAVFFFSSISFYNWFLSFTAIILGAASIAQDYEKQTGHQLFPRISRGRLLAGRVIGLYILYASVIALYYLMIGISTAIKFDGAVPIELYYSLGLALLFGFTTLSYVFLLSALMKGGGAFGLAIGTLVFAFMMLELLVPMFFKIEPIFVLSYYFKILTSIFDMPDPRYVDAPNLFRPSVTSRTWITPSLYGALLGMIIYTVACLGLAYWRFRTRQLSS